MKGGMDHEFPGAKTPAEEDFSNIWKGLFLYAYNMLTISLTTVIVSMVAKIVQYAFFS